MKYFKNNGYKTLVAKSDVQKHQKYLLDIGFIRSSENKEIFVKDI